jgi:hypothetical protein
MPSLDILNLAPTGIARGLLPYDPALVNPVHMCCESAWNETVTTVNGGCVIWCELYDTTVEDNKDEDNFNMALNDSFSSCIQGQTLESLRFGSYWSIARGPGEFTQEDLESGAERMLLGPLSIVTAGLLMIAAFMG